MNIVWVRVEPARMHQKNWKQYQKSYMYYRTCMYVYFHGCIHANVYMHICVYVYMHDTYLWMCMYVVVLFLVATNLCMGFGVCPRRPSRFVWRNWWEGLYDGIDEKVCKRRFVWRNWWVFMNELVYIGMYGGMHDSMCMHVCMHVCVHT